MTDTLLNKKIAKMRHEMKFGVLSPAENLSHGCFETFVKRFAPSKPTLDMIKSLSYDEIFQFQEIVNEELIGLSELETSMLLSCILFINDLGEVKNTQDSKNVSDSQPELTDIQIYSSTQAANDRNEMSTEVATKEVYQIGNDTSVTGFESSIEDLKRNLSIRTDNKISEDSISQNVSSLKSSFIEDIEKESPLEIKASLDVSEYAFSFNPETTVFTPEENENLDTKDSEETINKMTQVRELIRSQTSANLRALSELIPKDQRKIFNNFFFGPKVNDPFQQLEIVMVEGEKTILIMEITGPKVLKLIWVEKQCIKKD